MFKDRLGFVKVALEKNLPIIPVMGFGEKWQYRKNELPEWWKPVDKFMKKNFKMTTDLFVFGRWGCTVLPRVDGPTDGYVGFVFGRPIPVQGRTVEAIHKDVCDSMERIFKTYKHRFRYAEDETLEIVNVKDGKSD